MLATSAALSEAQMQVYPTEASCFGDGGRQGLYVRTPIEYNVRKLALLTTY